jgi:uncharacterized protein with GYD domain
MPWTASAVFCGSNASLANSGRKFVTCKGASDDEEDGMPTFITQARFTKHGLNAMIAASEDRMEIVGRLIAQAGGKVIGHYLTSGEYDLLLIFEAPSYEDAVPALIIAAAGSDLTDLKTVTALTSSEMKAAFGKAGSIAASSRSSAALAAGPAPAQPVTDQPKSDSQPEGEKSSEEAKAAKAILDAEAKAVANIRAGRAAPYYLTPPGPSEGELRRGDRTGEGQDGP